MSEARVFKVEPVNDEEVGRFPDTTIDMVSTCGGHGRDSG
jgi:hypothetical protein